MLLGATSAALGANNILVFGDSLSAGYGLPQGAAWPDLLAKRLVEKKLNYSVVNASISGETTSGGVTRLPDAIKKNQPKFVIIALGANDGLRGLSLKLVKDNLLMMAAMAKNGHAKVVIVGQRLPPNFGAYAKNFYTMFEEVARETGSVHVEFLLEGIADDRSKFQADNLHPTAEAQPKLLDNVWKKLGPLLK